MPAWFEDDSFWSTLERFFFTKMRTDTMASAEVHQIVRLLDARPGASMLDLGCGLGRHALALARRGFRVTGVDRATRYLDAARRRALKELFVREYQPRDWHYSPEGGEYLVEARSVHPGGDWVENEWTWLRGGERRVFRVGLRLYSGPALVQVLRELGFSSVDAYGNFEGAPYDETVQRLVVVGVR